MERRRRRGVGTLRRGISLLQSAFEAFLQALTGNNNTYTSIEAATAGTSRRNGLLIFQDREVGDVKFLAKFIKSADDQAGGNSAVERRRIGVSVRRFRVALFRLWLGLVGWWQAASACALRPFPTASDNQTNDSPILCHDWAAAVARPRDR